MERDLIGLFNNYQEYAIVISLLLNILIAVLGVIPSFFITGANIIFFGFWEGILISLLGETFGAIIAFLLYRKGFKKLVTNNLSKYPRLISLTELEGSKAFFAVFSLRLMPFIPSGLVTFAAAIGKISIITFAFSSSLGKIPALFIEGFTVYQLISFSLEAKLLLLFLGIIILWFNLRKSK